MSRLLQLLVAFVAGAILTSAGFVLGVAPLIARDKYDFGRSQGYVDGQSDIVVRIPKALGSDYSKEVDGYHPLFEVKATAVVTVERNGVKTLRVYPE